MSELTGDPHEDTAPGFDIYISTETAWSTPGTKDTAHRVVGADGVSEGQITVPGQSSDEVARRALHISEVARSEAARTIGETAIHAEEDGEPIVPRPPRRKPRSPWTPGPGWGRPLRRKTRRGGPGGPPSSDPREPRQLPTGPQRRSPRG